MTRRATHAAGFDLLRNDLSSLAPQSFVPRHIGSNEADLQAMLHAVGAESFDTLLAEAVPADILEDAPAEGLPEATSEEGALAELRALGARNTLRRSLLGGSYAACVTPPVIQRNVLENPGWYTQYTPYQAEIAQGRLEVLLSFQTLVAELCGLPVANASLLDEATAAAEAMAMCFAKARRKRPAFLVDKDAHPATIAVMRTRAESLGIELRVDDTDSAACFDDTLCGVLITSPDTRGRLREISALSARCAEVGAACVVSADLLALTLVKAPGDCGADIVVGNAQRFGMPLGLGGPHAGFIATRGGWERLMPGRLVGVSVDARGQRAVRLALQTREQHIRRERATSNICTAQALPAIVAALYAGYHGWEGLRQIATRVGRLAASLHSALRQAGIAVEAGPRFDTIVVHLAPEVRAERLQALDDAGFELRQHGDGALGITLDERSTCEEVAQLAALLCGEEAPDVGALNWSETTLVGTALARTDRPLQHDVFERYRTEHEMLRYLKRLENRDLSLTHSMIALGSCTMKLNATAEMMPISWPEFADLHPMTAANHQAGYREMFAQLEDWLATITGFAAVSLQPNAGSQGEYAGLLAIRAWHASRGQAQRDVCLIPTSAHGTNPASAVIAGMRVVAVQCDEAGNIDLDDLALQAGKHADELAALMITYPSTHGVFEEEIRRICDIVHEHGGQVYLDGANLNAQVGVCRPGAYGADVCHMNLHKTFCIPHGGGGPGMGPIAVAGHLAPFLPSSPYEEGGAVGAVSAAPMGSGLILTIPWMYIRMMGGAGLRLATSVAVLNANYMVSRLKGAYDILYVGRRGRVAHEFIIDFRPFKAHGVEVEDVAKRLMDYGFHAPTMSFPVPGTLMVEPTESESREEIDRFCEAMLAIREEIAEVAAGNWSRDDNPLVNAPHTMQALTDEEWAHPYSRQRAVFPCNWQLAAKFWPAVARIDNGHGDRNLICTCPSVEELAAE